MQKLGEMTEAAPELVLPDWAQRTTLTLKDSTGSVVVPVSYTHLDVYKRQG